MRKTLFTASALATALAAPSPRLSKPGTSSFALVRLPLIRVRIAALLLPQVPAQLLDQATLDSDTQLGLNFAYMVTDKVGIELLAATPFSHDVGVKGLPETWTASSAASSICHRP